MLLSYTCMYCIVFWEPVNNLILMFIALYKLYVTLTPKVEQMRENICYKLQYIRLISLLVPQFYILWFGHFSKSSIKWQFLGKVRAVESNRGIGLLLATVMYDTVLYHKINRPLDLRFGSSM
jgi:hypothetical protein